MHRLPILAALVVVLSACTGPTGSVRFMDETTADGLRRIRSSRLDRVWLMPGASLQEYSEVVLLPVTVAYKRPPRGRGRSGNFALTSTQMERLERSFQDAFTQEIGNSPIFEIVSEPGPQALSVRGRIVDLVLEVEPSPPGRGGTFVRRTGVMTLILDVSDSITGAPLARVADRSEMSPTGGFQGFESNPVNNAAAVRQTLSRWARILRDGLDALHGLPEIAETVDGT